MFFQSCGAELLFFVVKVELWQDIQDVKMMTSMILLEVLLMIMGILSSQTASKSKTSNLYQGCGSGYLDTDPQIYLIGSRSNLDFKNNAY